MLAALGGFEILSLSTLPWHLRGKSVGIWGGVPNIYIYIYIWCDARAVEGGVVLQYG